MVDLEVVGAGIHRSGVIAAMRATPRHEFVPPAQRQLAYLDMALPIGEHQTISTPFMVALMTEQIEPQIADKVLEIGTGSGYQAAVLSGLVREVYTIEIDETLGKSAAETLESLGYRNVKTKIGDGFQGWPEAAPFDKIIVTCSSERVPQPLIDQLREGGRMVIPLGERFQQVLYQMQKVQGKLQARGIEPTFFVPMRGTAEQVRAVKSNETLSPLVNGGFEQASVAPDKPDGWYYVRLGRVEPNSGDRSSGHCLTFSNTTPGRPSQALQALGIDGRAVEQLEIRARVRAHDVQPGVSPDQQPRVLLTYFDENRVPLGQSELGPWKGDFNWSQKSGRAQVPLSSRLAVVAIGLLGATGEVAFDDIEIRGHMNP